MPYIREESRVALNKIADEAFSELTSLGQPYAGNLNYLVSTILGKLFDNNSSYATINELIGAVECIKLEFYRRVASGYEDGKIIENGDLPEYTKPKRVING